MLTQHMFLKLYTYNHMTNLRLLDLAARVTPDQWSQTWQFGQRSLHETLFHLLTVEEEWFQFCQRGTPNWNYRRIGDYPDAESLRVAVRRVSCLS